MNIRRYSQAVVLVLCASLIGPVTAKQKQAHSADLDIAKIERLTGLRGTLDKNENVFKISQPRSDLNVTVAGVKIIPPMGLTSWAAFKPAGHQVMVMGDLVLQEDQVNTVMSEALDNGIEVTALHNHFLWDTPKVMFMHIGGTGDSDKLAIAVGRLFEAIQSTTGSKSAPPSSVSIDATKTSLDLKGIESIIGAPLEKTGNVYKVTLGLTTKMAGHEAGKAMGVNTWAVFTGSNEQASVDGDFAMRESELQGVLKALRTAGINITAIHNHMRGESPSIVFLHYWGTGPANNLAKGIKSALDTQKTAKPKARKKT
ncbi:DUF1259 domain-containing protein [Methylobacter sp. YRD-M1]|uniref:DUF1259 domain-containing protein n=1 Tax=Methylobacter sp. YRD-M1 TaxID=2911520 RepID=UPI00227A3BE0|nr:DUF1259 domain-containing protein [Methylobacter sp. YRD-M1]WAK00280.1 DUF1259 domain-containing protein [Methylobacter sp. YRD-M1]